MHHKTLMPFDDKSIPADQVLHGLIEDYNEHNLGEKEGPYEDMIATETGWIRSSIENWKLTIQLERYEPFRLSAPQTLQINRENFSKITDLLSEWILK